MAELHRVPWFPAWGIRLPDPVSDPVEIITIFNEWRPSERWLLLAHDAAASEVHLWTVWHALRRRESAESMIANSPDTEFIRLISGTHQIRTAFERAGLKEGDSEAWIINLPDFDDGASLCELEIPRQTFNEATLDAERLILHLKSELLAHRPIPTLEGLARIGANDGIVERTNDDVVDGAVNGPATGGSEKFLERLEDAFMLHAAMSDLSG